MKLFSALFLLAGLFVANAASASPLIAISEFRKNPEVNSTVRSVVENIKKFNGEDTMIEISVPTVADLGGGCGFAGCQSIYLVTVKISPQVTNSQSEVVAAYVNLMNDHLLSLKVIPATRFTSIIQNLE